MKAAQNNLNGVKYCADLNEKMITTVDIWLMQELPFPFSIIQSACLYSLIRWL